MNFDLGDFTAEETHLALKVGKNDFRLRISSMGFLIGL